MLLVGPCEIDAVGRERSKQVASEVREAHINMVTQTRIGEDRLRRVVTFLGRNGLSGKTVGSL